MKRFSVDNEKKNKRLDIAISEILKTSRSYVKFLIDEKYVKVNNKNEKPSYITQEGDKIEVNIPKTNIKVKENIPIVYKDKDFVIYNKPWGMSVHPNESKKPRREVMLTDIISKDFPQIEKKVDRVGIVHRLDKNTSGIIIVSLSNRFSCYIKEQFKKRLVQKTYKAVVLGILKPSKGHIKAPIARSDNEDGKMAISSENEGRMAETEYRVDEYLKDGKNQYSLLTIYPKTGRTHQIRVHLSSIGHPIVGDRLYGYDKKNAKRQLLHAESITFKNLDNKEESFSCPIPKDFIDFINSLNKA